MRFRIEHLAIFAIAAAVGVLLVMHRTEATHTACDYAPDMDCNDGVTLADASRLIAHVGESRCADGITYAQPGACPATPTPTATPTPSAAYNVADLLDDSTGAHEIDPCGVGGFDWENNGVVQSTGPGSRTAASAWFAYQWDCGAAYASGVTASLRNMKGYAWNGSTWIQYEGGVDWCNFVYPPSGPYGADCTTGSGEITWTMPHAIESGRSWPRSIHGATSIVTFPAGTQCIVTTGEGKVTGSSAVALHWGADWGAPGQTQGGAVVGRFAILGPAWRFFGASSCGAGILNASPPPGVAP